MVWIFGCVLVVFFYPSMCLPAEVGWTYFLWSAIIYFKVHLCSLYKPTQTFTAAPDNFVLFSRPPSQVLQCFSLKIILQFLVFSNSSQTSLFPVPAPRHSPSHLLLRFTGLLDNKSFCWLSKLSLLLFGSNESSSRNSIGANLVALLAPIGG